MLNRTFATGGGVSSIVKVPGNVPPAKVYFFKVSSLAKGIRFANFSPFSLGKGMPFGNFSRFWFGQGYAFWQIRSKTCQTSLIPVKKPKFFQTLVLRMQKFGKFCLENALHGTLSACTPSKNCVVLASVTLISFNQLKIYRALMFVKILDPPLVHSFTKLTNIVILKKFMNA